MWRREKKQKHDDVIRERSTKSLKYVGYINAVIKINVSVKKVLKIYPLKMISNSFTRHKDRLLQQGFN